MPSSPNTRRERHGGRHHPASTTRYWGSHDARRCSGPGVCNRPSFECHVTISRPGMPPNPLRLQFNCPRNSLPTYSTGRSPRHGIHVDVALRRACEDRVFDRPARRFCDRQTFIGATFSWPSTRFSRCPSHTPCANAPQPIRHASPPRAVGAECLTLFGNGHPQLPPCRPTFLLKILKWHAHPPASTSNRWPRGSVDWWSSFRRPSHSLCACSLGPQCH